MAPIDPSNIEGLWTLTKQGMDFVFPEAWGGQELFAIFFLAFITYLLLKTGADRISFAFVITFCVGAMMWVGVIQSPALWGIIILAGAVLTFRAIATLLSE